MDRNKIWGGLILMGIICLLWWSISHEHEGPMKFLAHTAAPEPRVHTFGGFPCQDVSCSGHKAGFDWASAHSIHDVADCKVAGAHSNSPAFEQGCIVYINEGNYDEVVR
jgi:hypothetical protein